MRLALKITLGVTLGGASLLVLLFIAFVVYWPATDCSSMSPAVAKARALSQEELAALYEAMTEFSHAKPSAWVVSVSSVDELPERIAALAPRNVRFNRPSIVLEGCFDHFVIMSFHGIPDTEYYRNEAGIDLQWGEWEPDAGSERLWAP